MTRYMSTPMELSGWPRLAWGCWTSPSPGRRSEEDWWCNGSAIPVGCGKLFERSLEQEGGLGGRLDPAKVVRGWCGTAEILFCGRSIAPCPPISRPSFRLDGHDHHGHIHSVPRCS